MSDKPNTSPRHGLLTVFLTLFVGGGFLLFLVLISSGLLAYLTAVMLGMFVFGAINYLLWGRAFSQQVAWEREELEIRERQEEPTRD